MPAEPLPPPNPYYQPPMLLVPARPTRPGPYFWVAIAASTAGMLAAFLPWVSATALFAHVEASGIGRDGNFTLGMGVVAAILTLALLRTGTHRIGAVFVGLLGAGMALVGAIDLSSLTAQLTKVNNSEYVHAEVGVGLYLTVAAGVALVVGAFMAFRAGGTRTGAPAMA